MVVRDHRGTRRHDAVRVQPTRRVIERRRPVYASNGRFVFNGGVSYNYRRPVIQYRYTDYRYRPQILAENYEPVSGYIWVGGQWQWNGYEWSWVSGHYDLDPSYQYSSSNYDNGYDNAYDGYYQSPVSDQPCD
ncbi:MAG: repeat (2 copies) [Deltaproteobacteria bacterium]|nr:repeat (2 copies) [Deltaproteobacteria bacterium]